jgi:hypothetical protein
MNVIASSPALLAALLACGAAQAQARPPTSAPASLPTALPASAPDAATSEPDRAELGRTQIIGNRELPKVLMIVPWKKPLPGELAAKPLGSLMDEVLAPLDRDVFRRQVQYDQASRQRAAAAPRP